MGKKRRNVTKSCMHVMGWDGTWKVVHQCTINIGENIPGLLKHTRILAACWISWADAYVVHPCPESIHRQHADHRLPHGSSTLCHNADDGQTVSFHLEALMGALMTIGDVDSTTSAPCF